MSGAPRRDRHDRRVLALLAALPALAYLPAIGEGRLLGPGDGAALHFPLRAEAWSQLREGELPAWNHAIFGGTPLLASYRPGTLHPLMLALAPLEPFEAFQLLVLVSLSAAAGLVFLYLRRLGAGPLGAYFGGLSFALGPYLVSHLSDTATLVAAPALPLMLLAVEGLLLSPTPARATALAGSVALLLLAGSVEAAGAGACLLTARLLAGPLGLARPIGTRALRATLLGAGAGLLLAGPQLVPTALAFSEAGRQATGLADDAARALSGGTGLVLRYVSHTPAGALALSALPLLLRASPLRALGAALPLWLLGLQWGRGPLVAPGSFALLFDLTLSLLAGLALSVQWQARRDRLGRKLRSYFLFWSLTSAAALSVATADGGPLPLTQAGSVGVLALALILYFSFARSNSPSQARVWLLPLTVSFLLQPQGRSIWESAPTRRALGEGTPTSAAIDRALEPRPEERVLTLALDWPGRAALDLGFANLGMLWGRRSANGYDPLTPLRNRVAFESMGPGGVLSEELLRSDPRRLELMGLRWVQVPTPVLLSAADGRGVGARLNLAVEPGRARFLPLPIVAATQLQLAGVVEGVEPAPPFGHAVRALARLATGRFMPTAAPSLDRAGAGAVWSFPLPGRYLVDGVRVERVPGPGRAALRGVGVRDRATGSAAGASAASGYVSDGSRLREAATTPFVRLFEITTSPGAAHVAASLWVVSSEDAVLGALRSLEASGLDPRQEALAVADDVAGVSLPRDGRAARARVARSGRGRLDVRAPGPGLLVVAEGWDPGWSAAVDGEPARVLRVNHVQMGVVLGPGLHRVAFEYRPRGFILGTLLAASAALGLAAAALRTRRVAPRAAEAPR